MSTNLVRPSAAHEDLLREARKLERGRRPRLTIETTTEVLHEVGVRAALKGVTVREYLLELLLDDGVTAARDELAEARLDRQR